MPPNKNRQSKKDRQHQQRESKQQENQAPQSATIEMEPRLTGNEEHVNDIFSGIDTQSALTNLVVTEDRQLGKNQQVGVNTGEMPSSSHETDQQDIITTPEESSDPLEIAGTLTRLTTSNGAEVYLIGTAHFSLQSVEDVRKVIRTVQPSSVILELCRERAFMLSHDEQSLLEQNRSLSFEKIRNAIREKGVAQGLIYIMFIKMSASLTEKLGLAPGAEFRAGSAEAQKIPGCSVILGDRSLRVTVARAVASVSLWQKMKLIFQVLINDVAITQDDVEKCKDRDMLEQLLQELGVEFPGFKRVILDERNLYLAHSIYHCAQNSVTSTGPLKVVAIVGIGHVSGIVENWGKTSDEEIQKLVEMPTTSRTRKVVGKTVKYCSIALLVYFGYRAIVPSNIQNAVYNKLTG